MNVDQLNDLLERGVHLAGAGQTTDARIYFTKAVKGDPESAFAWYYLGAVVEDQDKKSYCFSRAASLDPDIQRKVAEAHALRPQGDPDQGSFTPLPVEGSADDPQEDTGPIPASRSEPMPAIKTDGKTGRRKRIPLFWILFSILLLVLAIIAGAAYWVLFMR